MQGEEHEDGAMAKERRCTNQPARTWRDEERFESGGSSLPIPRSCGRRLVHEMQGIPEAAGGQELNGEKTRVDTEQLWHADF